MNSHVARTLSFSCLVAFCLATAAVADDSTNEKEGAASGVAPAKGNSVNVLAKIKLPADSVSGDWKKAAGGLQSKSSERARLQIKFQPEGEYDFRVSFTRTEGEEGIAQLLTFKGRTFLWVMGSYHNRCSGFALVKGMPSHKNPTTVKSESVLTNGEKYTAEVRVRNGSVAAYLNGELVSVLETNYYDLSCPKDWEVGVDSLGFIAESPVVLHSAVVVPVVGGGDAILTPTQRKYVASKEKAAKGLHEEMVKAINTKATDIKNSGLHPDMKQIKLNRISSDLIAFKQFERLPNCDELLGEIVNYLDGYQERVLDHVESTRLTKVDAAIRGKNMPGNKPELVALEEKFEKIVGGREQFAAKSEWVGSRFFDDHAVEVYLRIDDRQGNGFEGFMQQNGTGGIKMKVAGVLHGNAVWIRNTQMISGKNRQLEMAGYLLSDRMVAKIGDDGKGQTQGTISLNKKKK